MLFFRHASPTTKAVFSAVFLVVLVLGLWFLLRDGVPDGFGTIRPSVLTQDVPYEGAPLLGNYKNKQFKFALDIPEGFTAGELPVDENGGTAIILQNTNGEGIQIYIVPEAGSKKVLTVEDIRRDIPDMKIDSVEPVDIGSEYKGVAFLSDNEAFGGASREVWFYFRGNLYQISTYEKLDTLLKAMFGTWTFF